jgi:Protein of unknown function (DUF2867)
MTPAAPTLLPDTAIHLLAPIADLDFFDSQSAPLSASLTPLQAWNRIMARPLPLLGWAFWLRDAISARFGVRRIGGFSGQPRDRIAVGDRLDFFVVEHVSPEVLTLTERDRHLDVMTCVAVCDGVLSITSSVVTHNLFGRLYMLPVAPAHRWIVRAMLARLTAQG